VRVVLDCNVVIAAGMTEGACRKVVSEAVRHHAVLLSDEILGEYRSVAARVKFEHRREVLDAIIATIAEVATQVDPSNTPFRLADPDDEVYLGTAVAGGAEALVTGNTRHFPEKVYGTIAVLSPREFLERVL
jgi:putative PIN family toxin of toxin-antitoxin system